MSDSSVQFNIGSSPTMNGVVSLHYVVPEQNPAFIQVVTTDDRGLQVALVFSDNQFEMFKNLIAKLENTIQRFYRPDSANATSTGLRRVPGTAFPLPEELYNEVTALVIEGKAVLAAMKIQKSVPGVDWDEARRIANIVYEMVRQEGLRE